ncbi:ATP synthase protein I [Brevirhabdus pacifica]|nr:ATP synthase protein I [Brevirhabdus pacifica]
MAYMEFPRPYSRLTPRGCVSRFPATFRMGFAMVSDADKERLKQLDARIAAAKSARKPKPHSEEHYSQAHLAWRMVIELVAGLGIGFGIGYGLDYVLETLPIFLVLFTLLGFAAGVKTMMRTAKEAGSLAQAKQAEDEGN